MKSRIVRYIGAVLAGVVVAFNSLTFNSEAVSYTANYTDRYTAEEMMATILSTTTDANLQYRQIKIALTFGTISRADIYTLAVKYSLSPVVMEKLMNDGLITTYVYKTYCGIPIAKEDMALVFDPVFYYTAYPDVQVYGYNEEALFNHFLTVGMPEGRVGSANFNPVIYKANYPNMVNSLGNVNQLYYQHYLLSGCFSGLKAN